MIVLVILFFGLCVWLVHRSIKQLPSQDAKPKAVPKRVNHQLEVATEYAARLFAEKKYLAAEKAYVEVIKLDHKNVTAYIRLGKIYMSLKNYSDAIESFQIGVQLAPNAANFFNLGTVYYENRNFMKAIAAFERSVALEPTASRYVALGRVYQRMSNSSRAVVALEKAVELDPSLQNQQLLLEAYRGANDHQKARALQEQLSRGPKTPQAV